MTNAWISTNLLSVAPFFETNDTEKFEKLDKYLDNKTHRMNEKMLLRTHTAHHTPNNIAHIFYSYLLLEILIGVVSHDYSLMYP